MLLNLRELLTPAVKEKFAIGGFNVTESTMFKAIVEEAECRKSPVIIQVSPNEFQFAERELYLYFVARLQKSSTPFALHYDHSKSYEGCIQAIQAGFTSVMFDGSQLSYSKNVKYTRDVVRAAHGVGVSVEGEIGSIGKAEDYINGTIRDMVYTSPELAVRFVKETGIDALAVSIGTVHGLLPDGYVPQLQIGLLKELAAAVSVPLVLHGGSGTPHKELAEACREGIYKVNISSEFKHAYYQSVRNFVTENPERVSPTLVLKQAVQAVKDIAGEKMHILNSEGKEKFYRNN